MRIVAALGASALLERGEPPDAIIQHRRMRHAAQALVPLAADHELVICHGNGSQVALLARESTADETLSEPYPLDVLGAQTQGMIGYWLAQELRNSGVVRPIAAVVTQTVVESADPAFEHPTKFIGPVYHRHAAQKLATQHGWAIAQDGSAWRRVVPSPEPFEIIELPAVRVLLNAGAVAICTGGGGAPVIENEAGQLVGVEAVVDEDLTAALLARDLNADALLLLTDVSAVMRDFGTEEATPISRISVAELSTMSFPDGSMGTKIEAGSRFVEATGGHAAIGALSDAVALLAGTAGTTILPSRVDAATGEYLPPGSA
jgi:carbamate kinase